MNETQRARRCVVVPCWQTMMRLLALTAAAPQSIHQPNRTDGAQQINATRNSSSVVKTMNLSEETQLTRPKAGACGHVLPAPDKSFWTADSAVNHRDFDFLRPRRMVGKGKDD